MTQMRLQEQPHRSEAELEATCHGIGCSAGGRKSFNFRQFSFSENDYNWLNWAQLLTKVNFYKRKIWDYGGYSNLV